MNRAARSIALSLSCLLAACGGSPQLGVVKSPSPTPTPAPVRVVIVSVDGLRPDAVQQVNPPNMRALVAKGAYSWLARTIMPSSTLPSHMSMLTGYLPARHGVTWNDYTPANGPLKVTTVFLAARRAGLRSALVAGKDKFDTFRDTGEMDMFIGGGQRDQDVADQAVAQLYTGVHLLFVHLPNVDIAGHTYGWMSTGYKDEVARADAALGRIMNALPDNTTLILSADHGGHGNEHGSADPLDMTIPWIVAGPRTRQGYALAAAVSTTDTTATAGFLLGLTLPADITGKPVLEAFVR